MNRCLIALIWISACNAAEEDWTASIFRLTSGDPTVTGNPKTVVVSRMDGAVVLVIQEGGRMRQRTKIMTDKEFSAFASVVREAKAVEDDGEFGYWVACEYLVNGQIHVKKFNRPIGGNDEIKLPDRNAITPYDSFLDLLRKSAQQVDAPDPTPVD